MLPPRRLDTLLTQARAYQRSTCAYHQAASPADSFSLYADHSCTRAQFPTLTSHILAEHTDEVWRLEWSHDGRYLASTSQDKTAIIWKIGVTKSRVLETVRMATETLAIYSQRLHRLYETVLPSMFYQGMNARSTRLHGLPTTKSFLLVLSRLLRCGTWRYVLFPP